jgi:tRNA-2-methylthio-N6-dimethylallyladenosine synthase
VAASLRPSPSDTSTSTVRPGDVVQVTVTYAAPHHLVSDAPASAHRRTRAGDNWAAGRRPVTPGVPLGLPSFGVPVTVAAGCGAR